MDEFKTLIEKAESGVMTPEEQLTFLKELGKGVGALNEFLKKLQA